MYLFLHQFENRYGTWVRIDSDSAGKFCFETEGEAWSLAINKHGVAYMKITQDGDDDVIFNQVKYYYRF